MSKMMEHKGYYGSVEFSPEDKVFFGKLEYISDLVSFEATEAPHLEKAFHDAVDDYLITCQKAGKEPDKPCKGSFNVRVAPDIHRGLAKIAASRSVSLNAVAEEAFREYLKNLDRPVGRVYRLAPDDKDSISKSKTGSISEHLMGTQKTRGAWSAESSLHAIYPTGSFSQSRPVLGAAYNGL
jgi:predicted HicB family RNase H-like nuclease